MHDQPILFGPFRLEPAAGRLLRDGAQVALGNRALALLQALAEANGQLVTKSALMERVWPGQIVEEGNLTVQIAALRKSMGTDSEGRDWILTVPRGGYRLAGGSAAPPALPPTPVLPSLAVLPFLNLSGDPEQDYFADGIVEDIITALSRFKSFAVIARNSSFAYKGRAVDVRQVAEELGVRYVLEGSVRRAGQTLRIAAQLVDGVTGAHLWAQTFDGALEDVFDVQDRITENVAMVAEPRIQAAELERSRRERPGSIAAYDLYLRALTKRTAEAATDHADAYALLIQALELEPENAQLLALAASALSGRNTIDAEPFSADDTLKCAELAHRSLELAAGDAVVMVYCGAALIHTVKDYDLGMAAIRSALEANPNNHVVVTFAGIANLHCGPIEEALACLHRAMRLSPRDPHAFYALTGIAHVQMVLGNDTEALVWASRSRALRPNYPCNLWILIAASARLGRMADARRHLAELKNVAPGISVSRIWAGQPQMDPGRMANILDGLRLAGLLEDAAP